VLTSRPVVDVRVLGAVGDGSADDGDAIRRGLAEVNASSGTLYFPSGTYTCRATGPLRPAAGVTLAGDPGASTILFHSTDAARFLACIAIDAPGITLDGLIVRRASVFRAVLIDLGSVAGFRLRRSALVGDTGDRPDVECHGIKFPDGGVAQDIEISDSRLQDLTYGLFQTNASTAAVTGVTVERCTLTGNHNTDLEFNSPNGSISRIRIRSCAFSDNDSDGFGVGLAHVRDAVVQDCTFDTYGLEAVHVEDYSDTVTILANRFAACGLRDHSHVQVISGCSRVRVLDNVFDATRNTDRIHVVNALPGGTQTTPGGRPPSGPSDVFVGSNSFDCSEASVPVYFQAVRRGTITDNSVTGTALGSPADAFRLLEDPGTAVTANVINGWVY